MFEMNKIKLVLCVLLLSIPAFSQEKPSVVLFYADDLGRGDLSIHNGNTPTPNIDRIFNSGIQFENYTTHCVCSPSRAGLLTGRHYLRMKAGPEVGGEMPLKESTIAESFKTAGYATGCFGKWDNGAATGGEGFKNPKKIKLGHGVNAHGFDRFVGYYGGGPNYFTRYSSWYQESAWYHDRKHVLDEEGYTTDLVTKYTSFYGGGDKWTALKQVMVLLPREKVK